jgi:hypothetical protein
VGCPNSKSSLIRPIQVYLGDLFLFALSMIGLLAARRWAP